jgi:parallel beta-helix repeat protein
MRQGNLHHCLPAIWLTLTVVSTIGALTIDVPQGPVNALVNSTDYQALRYVAQMGGSDRSGDGSARKPWASVSHALSRITDANATRRYAVLVAQGRYGGATLMMKSHVDLYGGFEPQGWRRDIFAHVTVLDGQGARRVVVGADHARLDGFTMTGGKVRAPGGAILCDRTSPTISHNVITGNATLEPADFIHEMLHQVGNDGGAIACLNGAKPVIASNLIVNNTTDVGGGGAIGCRNQSAPEILSNVIADNVTGLTEIKRSRSSNGGAISCSNSSPKIAHNLILNNRVGGNSDAGGIYCEYDSSPEMTDNYLVGNVAEDDGGAIYVMKSSEPTIAHNVIIGNNDGGAIRLSKEGRAKIEGNVICHNLAGGVECTNSWMTLTNNVISHNAGRGVGYSNRALPHIKPSILTGNIIRGNTMTQIGVEADENPIVTQSNVQGGFVGAGNTDADPLFPSNGISGSASGLTFDSRRFVTTLTIANGNLDPDSLKGRVIRVGTEWGVIGSNDKQTLSIWGNLRKNGAGATTFEIVPTYPLPK